MIAKPSLFTPIAVLALAACSSDPDTSSPVQSEADTIADTRSTDRSSSASYEGRLESGAECSLLVTPDGRRLAVNLADDSFGPGDYVRITGELADASFCMAGEKTLVANTIEAAEPPARDRDPARSGGVALTARYLVGDWVAKGASADCAEPDFSIRETPGALVLEGAISAHDDDARLVLGDYPRLDLDAPRDDLPLESRGPEGLAILRPATDAAYEPVTIGSATIAGDGAVFVKCG